MVRVATGYSQDPDAFQAGRDAAMATLAMAARQPGVECAQKPDLVLVFGDTTYAQQPLLDGIMSVVGFSVPMIGCSSAAQVASAGVLSQSVVAMALWCGSRLSCIPVKAESVSQDSFGAGQAIGRQALASLPATAQPTLRVVKAHGRFVTIRPFSLLFFAGSQPCTATPLVEGAASVVGPAFQVVGGLAHAGLCQDSGGTVYFNGQAITDAAVGVVLVSRTPLAIGLAHAFRPYGRTLVATRTEGSVVHELDGRPAVEVYGDEFGADAAALLVAGCVSAANPLGILESTGRYRVRQILGVRPGNALVCAAPVPEGVAVRWMADTPQDATAATRQATQDALDSLGAAHVAAALVFPASNGLRRHGADAAQSGLTAILDTVGHSTPVVGFGAAIAVATAHHGLPELFSQMCMTLLFGV